MPKLKRLGLIVGVVFVCVIGGCIAAYPIEDRRIGGFCDSVVVGSDVAKIIDTAREMFGVEIRQHPGAASVVVKSRFTYKTLCVIETDQFKVKSALFVND